MIELVEEVEGDEVLEEEEEVEADNSSTKL